MSNLLSFKEYTRIIVERYQDKEGIALDMTLGKGNDTLFLANFFKFVYAFDVQTEAIKASAPKLAKTSNVKLIKDTHENFSDYYKGQLSLVIYNLGYLPGSNQTITTTARSTISSLTDVLNKLKRKGIVILTVYPFHPAGQVEAEALAGYFKRLDSSEYHLSRYEVLNVVSAPYVVCIHKK